MLKKTVFFTLLILFILFYCNIKAAAQNTCETKAVVTLPNFKNETFLNPVDYSCHIIKNNAYFYNVEFKGEVYFAGTEFDSVVSFAGTEFKREVYFGDAKFCCHLNILS